LLLWWLLGFLLTLLLRLLRWFLLTLLGWLMLLLLMLLRRLFWLLRRCFLLFGPLRFWTWLPALLRPGGRRTIRSACFACLSSINCLLVKDFINKILFFEELCPLNFELLGYFPQFGNKHFAQFKNIMHMLRLCRKINKIFSDEAESEKVSPLIEYPDRTVITVQF
jgi:hypothetical protein